MIVGPIDLIDGTPILDIKPYLPNVDSFPISKIGWVQDVEDSLASAQRFEIVVEELAQKQLDWLKLHWQIDFTERAFALLAQDPSPHRTRRILKMGDRFRMACGPWRIFFQVAENKVLIQSIGKGYSDESLSQGDGSPVSDWAAQIAFAAKFG